MKAFMAIAAIGALVAAGFYLGIFPNGGESPAEESAGATAREPVSESAEPKRTPPPSMRESPQFIPRQVALLEATEFPAVMNGRTVGSAQVPAGTLVKVVDVRDGAVKLDHLGGTVEVPLSRTDIERRFAAAMQADAASIQENVVSRQLKDSLVVLRNGRIVPFLDRAFGARRYYLIYFAAGESGPSRRLSSQLVPFYREVRQKTGAVEFILASTDPSASAEDSQIMETGMPWPAIRFDANEAKGWVRRFAGPEYPCLVLIDGSGQVVSHTYKGGEFLGPANVMGDLERLVTSAK